MLATLALSLLLLLSVLRYFLEPACPGCAAKHWHDQAGALACSRCGWSIAAPAAARDVASAQYEIGLS